jgi:hypothetical protein
MESICPACPQRRARHQYTCRDCWGRLSPTARRRLNIRDAKAVRRLQQLYDGIYRGIPLSEIQISEDPQ